MGCSWDEKDRSEKVFWLQDIYSLPIYMPDEGPPRWLKMTFVCWSEVIGYFSACLSFVLIVACFCISPWFTIDIDCQDDGPVVQRDGIISAGFWERCINLEDKVLQTEQEKYCKKWDRTSLLNANWTDGEAVGCYSNFYQHRSWVTTEIVFCRQLYGSGIGFVVVGLSLIFIKSFNRNSLWNVAALMIFIGNTFILLPSVTVLLIPTQQKFASDIPVLTNQVAELVTEKYSIKFPAYLVLLSIIVIYTVIFTSFLRFYHFPYPYNQENRKKLDKIISDYQVLGTKKWDEYNKRQKTREKDLLQELDDLRQQIDKKSEKSSAIKEDGQIIAPMDVGLTISNRTQKNINEYKTRRSATNIIAEVDAISENSREDFSSIETKSPMHSIGRISGFSTMEAVSEEDEKNQVFDEYN